jgi:hypothetical protein
LEAEYKKFDIDKSKQMFDVGPNFWPNFVFTKTELLKKTDMNFDSKLWEKGEEIKEIDLVMKEQGQMDTFGWMSIQIRTLTGKIGYIPQFKAYPIDPYLARNAEWTFCGLAKWIHAGSLSSGVNMYLRDEENRPLFEPEKGQFKLTQFDHEDFVMRCAWWHLALETAGGTLTRMGLGKFADNYAFAIHRLMDEAKITKKELEERMDLYARLMNI